MGGDFHDLGRATDGEGVLALQPLARIDDPAERAWAGEWLAAVLAREGVAVTPEDKARLWAGLGSLASAPAGERTLTGLSILLQSAPLKQALQPFTLAGAWGRLLDGETEHLGTASIQAFETEGLMGSAARRRPGLSVPPAAAALDGRPTLVLIDEGWLALDDPGFGPAARMAEDLAQENASVVFATQSLADIRGSAIAASIIESCPRGSSCPTIGRRSRSWPPPTAASASTTARSRLIATAQAKRDYYCQSASQPAVRARPRRGRPGPVRRLRPATKRRPDGPGQGRPGGLAAAWLEHRRPAVGGRAGAATGVGARAGAAS